MSITINRVIMNIIDRINVVNVAYEQNIYTLFYKQHNYKQRQAEPWGWTIASYFENYSHSSSSLSAKIIGHILKNKQKNKSVCIYEIIRSIIMKMKMKIKNRWRRYDINRPRSRPGHKYSKYKKLSQYDDAFIY